MIEKIIWVAIGVMLFGIVTNQVVTALAAGLVTTLLIATDIWGDF